MKHLGDITKIHGAVVPPVEVIIGGSPCQDLSIAGKREGLRGERSGLFMEQIRIIKEMRAQDEKYGAADPRPKYMVFENVCGLFSSNNGEDFRIVLEETARVADSNAVIPRPPCGWANSGTIMGDGWSIAWRVHDAQFWGVPQRRRRIALVADFGGTTAPEILFERNCLSGNTAKSKKERQGAAAAIEERPGGTNKCYCLQGNGIDRADTAGCNGKGWTEDVCYTLNTVDRPAVYDALCVRERCGCEGGGKGPLVQNDKAGVLRTINDQFLCIGKGARPGNGVFTKQAIGEYKQVNAANTLSARDYKSATDLCVAWCIENSQAKQQEVMIASVDCRNGTENYDINGTLQAKSSGGTSVNLQNIVRVSCSVRRLTPLECERLQGYPDGWTDIGEYNDTKGKRRKASDAVRYKALGNSIALPFWAWMLERLNGYCEEHTMASLFDGIGGFPLIWETINGKGSCLWASEIEEFPIAVTKYHFGG